VVIKNSEELDGMKEACQISKTILERISRFIRPKMATIEIDKEAERLSREYGVVPAFKGYHGYPGNICVSVNDEIIHGIPSSEKILQEGDIVSLDFGVFHRGFFGDCADTVGVGEITEECAHLLEVTRRSFFVGLAKATAGNTTGDIGYAISTFVRENGYHVVREFAGHGIGRLLHEEPEVPNFGKQGTGARLVANSVIAIEPMVMAGGINTNTLNDGWTVVTADGSLAAHYEETVLVMQVGNQILTVIL